MRRGTERLRSIGVRVLAGTGIAVVLGAMVFGGQDDAPSLATPEATAATGGVHRTAYREGEQAPPPGEIARALRAAGFHVRVQRSADGVLIANTGRMGQEGSLNVQILPAADEVAVAGPAMVTPPIECLSVASPLGEDGLVLYGPALIDSGPEGCLPSETDRTAELIAALRSL